MKYEISTRKPTLIFLLVCTFLFLCSPLFALAQKEGHKKASKDINLITFARSVVHQSHTQIITLNVENDLFGNGTDKNYTSGVNISYFDPGLDPNALLKRFDRWIPTVRITDATSVYYTLGHNLYTPSDIRIPTQSAAERPWAAYLYGSIGMVTPAKKHLDEMEVSIGVVGPLAGGKQVQKFVHKHISHSPEPKGWHHQLKNEPAINVAWRRRWPVYGTQTLSGLDFSFTPHVGAMLGNVYTHVNGGAMFRVMPAGQQVQDAPLRVRPAMPGTGFFMVPEKTFSWYLFSGADIRLVGRNIFLDGNTFENSHSIGKHPVVADLSGGVALTYGKTRLSYTLNYRTKEFFGQQEDSIFGGISLGQRF